jgi:dienelactone hydrolase
MSGVFAYEEDAETPRPGVLVFPSAVGIGPQIVTAAKRLAGQGYAALACDLHGEGRFYDDPDAAMIPLNALRADLDGLRRRAKDSLAALVGQPQVDPRRVAAIGYCYGGVMALELARSGSEVCAVVGFHAPLATSRPDDAPKIKAKILICTGSEDPAVPAKDRAAFEAEMSAGGVDWRMSIYGGVYHSFTNPDADSYGKPAFARYDPMAHERSWREMLWLFEEAFAPQGP